MKKSFPKNTTIFLLLIFLPSLIYSFYLYQTGKNFYKIEQIHYPISVHLISRENDPVANSLVSNFAEDNFIEQVLNKEFFNNSAGIIYRNKKKILDFQGIQNSYVFYFDYFGDKKNLSYSKDNLINYMWSKYNKLYELAVKVIDKQNKKRVDDFLKLFEFYKQDYESIKELTNLDISECEVTFKTDALGDNVSFDCTMNSSLTYEIDKNFFKSLFEIEVIDNLPMQTNFQKNYNPSYLIFSIISIISLTFLIAFNFTLISSFSKKITK